MITAFLMQAAPAATTHTIGGPSTAYLPVMVFFVFAIIFPVLPLVLGRFLRPWKYQKDKMRPYECGIDPETSAHDRFTVRYYIVAMLFLIFDVETIFLFPWAVQYQALGLFGLVEMLVFLGILIVGYIWIWKRGALEWI